MSIPQIRSPCILLILSNSPYMGTLFVVSYGAVECDLLGATLNKSGVIYCMLVQCFCFSGRFYWNICRPDKYLASLARETHVIKAINVTVIVDHLELKFLNIFTHYS